MAIDRDRVKNRFLTELNTWLHDGLVYYAFTGEVVTWTIANDEFRRDLMKRAEQNWPHRLYRIEQSRKGK